MEISENQNTEQRGDYVAIKNARNFFQDLGIQQDTQGFLENDLTESQISELSNWQTQTREDSVLMPTEDSFYKKVLLAVSLWHQKDDQKVNYLMGKGAGIEIALRGRSLNHKKRPVEFEYRGHSDFELYAVDYESDEVGANINRTKIYPESFQQVFGNQEYFPLTKTKGLTNIPPTLLHETAEEVDFGGVKVLVPELELLFLDKFIAREATPRPEGYDFELLAKQYDLDLTKIHGYLDQLVVTPAVEKIQNQSKERFANQQNSIKRNLEFVKVELSEDGIPQTKENIVSFLNQKMEALIGVGKVAETGVYSGIRLALWESLKPEQVDEQGNITDTDFLDRLKAKIAVVEAGEVEKYKNKHRELDNLFASIV